MKRAEFLALVLSSVLFLKEKATPEELAKLGEITNPNHIDGCILGQMTGNSESIRAREISQKIMYTKPNVQSELEAKGIKIREGSFWTGSPRMNENVLQSYTIEPFEGCDGYAPFEAFILMDGANTTELVAFLKGEAETFVPTFNELAKAEA